MRFILVDLVLRCRLNPEKVVRMILPMGTLMAFQHGTHKTHTQQTKSVLFIPLCVSFFLCFSLFLLLPLSLFFLVFYTESDCFNTTRKTGLEQIDMKTSSKRKLARAFFWTLLLLLLIGSYCKSFLFSASQRSFRLDIGKAINDLCAITCYI